MNLEATQEKLDQIELDLNKIKNPEVKEILDEIIFALDMLVQGINSEKLSNNNS